jgi:hypothetical protein
MLTVKDIQEHVLLELGEGLVTVELLQPHLEQVVRQTLRVYSRHRPALLGESFVGVQGQGRYVLDDMGLRWGRGVVELQWPMAPSPGFQEPDIFSPVVTFFLRTGGTRWRDIADILSRQIELENVRLVTGRARDWDFKRELVVAGNPPQQTVKGVLYIHPPPIGGERFVYWYMDDWPAVELIPAGDEEWVLKYATAYAKLLLGRARDKWSNELKMDGAKLLDEAREELKALERELKTRGAIHFRPRQLIV